MEAIKSSPTAQVLIFKVLGRNLHPCGCMAFYPLIKQLFVRWPPSPPPPPPHTHAICKFLFNGRANCIDKAIVKYTHKHLSWNTLSGSLTSISVKFQTKSICILEKVSSSICNIKNKKKPLKECIRKGRKFTISPDEYIKLSVKGLQLLLCQNSSISLHHITIV